MIKKILIYLFILCDFLLINLFCYSFDKIPFKIKFIMESNHIDDKFYYDISKYSTFNENKLLDYYLLSKNDIKPYNYIYILNRINYPDFLKFNGDIFNAITKPIIFVNPKFCLSENFIPNNLIEIANFLFIKRNYKSYWDKSLINNYKLLSDFLSLHHYSIVIFSAYRSYSYQESLYNPSNPYTAKPGHSEHQTGLALDLSTLDIGLTNHFENSEIYSLLKENAYLFGFILRYPKEKEHLTFYPFEPWHYRFVGKEIAKKMYEENLCLEEYFYKYVLLEY